MWDLQFPNEEPADYSEILCIWTNLQVNAEWNVLLVYQILQWQWVNASDLGTSDWQNSKWAWTFLSPGFALKQPTTSVHSKPFQTKPTTASPQTLIDGRRVIVKIGPPSHLLNLILAHCIALYYQIIVTHTYCDFCVVDLDIVSTQYQFCMRLFRQTM